MAHLDKFVNRYNDIAIPDYGNPFSGGVDFQVVSCRPWMLQALVNYLPDPFAEPRLQKKIAYRIKDLTFQRKRIVQTIAQRGYKPYYLYYPFLSVDMN